MMRAALVAALAAIAVPGVAAADPNVPDQNVRESVRDLQVGPAVRAVDLSDAVLPLKEEQAAGGTVTVRISADVLFEFGRATLTATARREIGELAARLRSASGAVRVVGYTDSIGTPAANLLLSRRRAAAVKTELAKRAGAVTIVSVGRGEADPVAPNTAKGKDFPPGRAKNRRVEVTFRQT
ncbi:MAG TPA: OmpA family protein [Streptosporangiaceae bacterium]|jgi:outer membrane protein OmpA-like peptidoglycan-associated protein